VTVGVSARDKTAEIVAHRFFASLRMTGRVGRSSPTRFFTSFRMTKWEHEIATPRFAWLAMTKGCHSEECLKNTTWESRHLTGRRICCLQRDCHASLCSARNDRTKGLVDYNRDSHVGLRPPQNDTPPTTEIPTSCFSNALRNNGGISHSGEQACGRRIKRAEAECRFSRKK